MANVAIWVGSILLVFEVLFRGIARSSEAMGAGMRPTPLFPYDVVVVFLVVSALLAVNRRPWPLIVVAALLAFWQVGQVQGLAVNGLDPAGEWRALAVSGGVAFIGLWAARRPRVDDSSAPSARRR